MHTHNSFLPQTVHHCQDKLPQIISTVCQTFFLLSFSGLRVICSSLTLCLPLQEQLMGIPVDPTTSTASFFSFLLPLNTSRVVFLLIYNCIPIMCCTAEEQILPSVALKPLLLN